MFDLMATDIGLLLNRARTLGSAFIWRKVMSDVTIQRKIIQDYIQEDQLFNKGVDEDSDIIGTYSYATQLINPEKIEGDPYTLKDTGDFYKSMYIVVLNDSIVIEANGLKTDEKGETTDLLQLYGNGILGLTDENKTRLAMELIDRYYIEVQNLLFGNR